MLCPESRLRQRRARFSLPQQICGSPPEEPSLPALYDAIAGTLTEEALPSFGTEPLDYEWARPDIRVRGIPQDFRTGDLHRVEVTSWPLDYRPILVLE